MKQLEDTLEKVLKEYNEIYGHLDEETKKRAALESEQLLNELKENKQRVHQTHKLFSGTTILFSFIFNTLVFIWASSNFNAFKTVSNDDTITINFHLIASLFIGVLIIFIFSWGVSLYFNDYLNHRINVYTPDFSKTTIFEEKLEIMNESQKHASRNIRLGIIAFGALMLCIVLYSPYLIKILILESNFKSSIVWVLTIITSTIFISRIILQFKILRVQRLHHKKRVNHDAYYRNLKQL